MRDFTTWLAGFRSAIAGYKYYTDFEKIYQNVDTIKVELNILNSLIGSQAIEKEFVLLCKRYPEILKCIPILLAKRESDILTVDFDGEHVWNFKKANYHIEEYVVFMRETGLFDLMQQKHIHNLVDYVTGVENRLGLQRSQESWWTRYGRLGGRVSHQSRPGQGRILFQGDVYP